MLRSYEAVRSATGGQSGCLECHVSQAQSENEAISTGTLMNVLKIIVLRLHEVRDLRGHHMEQISV
jgi:hypothetical protein